jgi:hypothetical protein
VWQRAGEQGLGCCGDGLWSERDQARADGSRRSQVCLQHSHVAGKRHDGPASVLREAAAVAGGHLSLHCAGAARDQALQRNGGRVFLLHGPVAHAHTPAALGWSVKQVLTRKTNKTCSKFLTSVLRSVFAAKELTETYRPPIPAWTPLPYKNLIEICWDANAYKRPTFQAILTTLEKVFSQKKRSLVFVLTNVF